MGTEEDFLKKLEEEIGKKIQVQNTTSVPRLDNLSPTDMHHLLYNTFEEVSPIGFKKEISIDIIDKIPLINLLLEFLNKIEQAGELKLTKIGNLPRKICTDLYEMRIIKEENIESGIVKLRSEYDSATIQNVKLLGLLSNLIKKRNNKISLTALGKKMIKREAKCVLLKSVFLANFQKFNLGYHDGYAQNIGIQNTFGFTIYLLLRYGNKKRKLEFYKEKSLSAFPFILDKLDGSWGTPEYQYKQIYKLRIFERFLNYYGFLNYEIQKLPGVYRSPIDLETTELFTSVFEIRNDKFKYIKSGNLA